MGNVKNSKGADTGCGPAAAKGSGDDQAGKAVGRKLEIAINIENAVNYTKPYQQTVTASWRPDQQMLEYQCEENMEGAREG